MSDITKFPFDDLPIDALEPAAIEFVFLLKACWERSPQTFAKGLQILAEALPDDVPEMREQLQERIDAILAVH